jgi:Cu+-exporting ATPase
MFTLVALDTGAAWIYSVVATFTPGVFPASARRHGGAVPAYFEAAAVIVVLVLLGQVLELRARETTNGLIRALLVLAPKTARRVPDGREAQVSLAGWFLPLVIGVAVLAFAAWMVFGPKPRFSLRCWRPSRS